MLQFTLGYASSLEALQVSKKVPTLYADYRLIMSRGSWIWLWLDDTWLVVRFLCGWTL
jgi:hypothetical protein